MRKKILFSKRQSSYGKLEGINKKKKKKVEWSKRVERLICFESSTAEESESSVFNLEVLTV